MYVEILSYFITFGAYNLAVSFKQMWIGEFILQILSLNQVNMRPIISRTMGNHHMFLVPQRSNSCSACDSLIFSNVTAGCTHKFF